MIFISVDLPAPLRPTRQTRSFGSMCNSVLSNKGESLNDSQAPDILINDINFTFPRRREKATSSYEFDDYGEILRQGLAGDLFCAQTELTQPLEIHLETALIIGEHDGTVAT